tara:strand:- start:53 stop:436 length:384 start_codon:yes stop_codon:yes gene_type:complete
MLKRVEFKRKLKRCHLVERTYYATPQRVHPDAWEAVRSKSRAEPTRREFSEEEKLHKLQRCWSTAKGCEAKDTAEGCMLLLDRLNRTESKMEWILTGVAAQQEDALRKAGKPEPDGIEVGVEWWKED